MKKISLLLAFVISGLAFACLNYSIVGTDVNGKRKTTHAMKEHHRGLHIYDFDKSMIEKNGKYDLEEYKKTKNLDNYLNYATSLVYLGDYDKAISIFKEIEEKQPDKYELASNLGTAYELIGDNKNALKYIQKALQLNKDSHHGSEWIHVKILENKLGKRTLENLLDIDFGNDKTPTSKYKKIELTEFINDVSYQLSERTQFVKPTDKIVGKLYFELGNALSIVYDLESAQKAYNLSKKYGYENPLLNKRVSYFAQLIKDNKDSGKEVKETTNEELYYQNEDKNKTPEFKNVKIVPEVEVGFPFWIILPIILIVAILSIFIIKRKKR
ncbi:tetratricopeptide repeat protein [Epilithonimonas hungarica]|uniref:Tetratricopeptide repeat-containing protein n=1 Tax=Epilithonimonas hungarica TaxID=454006 RepID=A0A1G7RCH4_9FLAO|nr:tetratricopeptide repeat protein [Epilithonimonas hungarica]SDG08345.1 Tetratricopeptide repeat-containing protein [Epilithonimonas hungarica]